MTVKELAEMNHISCEAIRKQIRHYRKELEGHVHRQGRTQLLDEEAVAFLQERRNNNPVIIEKKENSALIGQLKEQNTILLAKVAEQAEKLAAQSEELRQFERLRLESSEKLLFAERQATESEQREKEFKARYERTLTELRRLRYTLKKEQERKLTVKERLFGRK